MNRSSKRNLPWLSLAAAAMLAVGGGCKARATAPTTASSAVPTPDVSWQSYPIPAPPVRVSPVAQGLAPLVYLVETDAVIRVADLTINQDVLSPMQVPARTVVAVNSASGITVGGASVKLGPLAADHRYGIFIEDTGENIVRYENVRPGQPIAKPQQPQPPPGLSQPQPYLPTSRPASP